MGVSLSRNRKDGKIYLRLKYQKKGMKPKVKSLGMYMYDPAKTTAQKKHNKEISKTIDHILLKEKNRFLSEGYGIQQDIPVIGILTFMMSEADKRSESTRAVWLSSFRMVNAFFNGYDRPMHEFTTDDLQELFEFILDRCKRTSAITYMSKVKSTFTAAYNAGIIHNDIVRPIKATGKPSENKIFLTIDEVRRFKKASTNKPIIKRAFLFGCLTGLRISDIRMFNRENLNYDSSSGCWLYQFHQKKTNGSALIPVSEEAYGLLGDLQYPFRKLPAPNTVINYLEDMAHEAGINKKINFHTSRHTFATLHISNGTDIYTVSKLLGHAKVTTTEIYAKLLDKKKIEAVNNIPSIG